MPHAEPAPNDLTSRPKHVTAITASAIAIPAEKVPPFSHSALVFSNKQPAIVDITDAAMTPMTPSSKINAGQGDPPPDSGPLALVWLWSRPRPPW